MLRFFWLMLVVTAIPLICFGLSSVARSKAVLDIRSELGGSVNVDRTIDQGSPTERCVSPEPDRPATCTTYLALGLLEQLALCSAAAGGAMLIIIGLVGQLARRSRLLLLIAFSVGLHLTNVALIGLILTHGLLVAGTTYLIEATVTEVGHPWLILGLGLASVIGALSLAAVTFRMVKSAELRIDGLVLGEREQPRIWELVKRLATKVGTRPPRHLILGLDPSFFVTDSPVQCSNGRLRGRTLFLSLPLSRLLSEDELATVLGHELGHFRGADLWFSKQFYPIYHGTSRSVAALAEEASDSWYSLALLPALSIMTFFFEAFAEAEAKIARERELAADLLGAQAVDARTAACALLKIHAFAPLWAVSRKARRRQNPVSSEGFANLSLAFAKRADEATPPAALDGLVDRVDHPTNAHPALMMRLANLSQSLAEVAEACLSGSPNPPAIDLIEHCETLERQLSEGLVTELGETNGRGIEPLPGRL